MSSPSLTSDGIKRLVLDAGAEVVAIAHAEPVDAKAVARYDTFISDGRHATMTFLENYENVRNDPRLLLDEGANSLIVCLFNYHSDTLDGTDRPRISTYALGRDYHKVVRRRLAPVARAIDAALGTTSRVCVDTAPLRERYWASRAGAGIIGLNNRLIVPGRGSDYVIGVIVTTAVLTPDEPLNPAAAHGDVACERCGRCVAACPTGALKGDGTIDARRCISYLTIESPEDIPDGLNIGNRIFGCDVCSAVCPHSRHATPTNIDDFKPREALSTLSFDDWENLDDAAYHRLFDGTAVRRASLVRLKANLKAIRAKQSDETDGKSAR